MSAGYFSVNDDVLYSHLIYFHCSNVKVHYNVVFTGCQGKRVPKIQHLNFSHKVTQRGTKKRDLKIWCQAK